MMPTTGVNGRRIFGLETEYGLIVRDEQGKLLSAPRAARELFAHGPDFSQQSATFLTNGGRLYVDVGAHPEYATAECDTVEELLAQDLAGDQLLLGLVSELKQRQPQWQVSLLRNNLDAAGNSFGCHENYLLRRFQAGRILTTALTSFLVARTALTGAGAVLPVPESQDWRFVISARAEQLTGEYSSGTTQERPIVNTRDQALADPGEYQRLHVIAGDTNISQLSGYLKIGGVLMVLSALEAGISFNDLLLTEPLTQLRALSMSANQSLQERIGHGVAAASKSLDSSGAESGVNPSFPQSPQTAFESKPASHGFLGADFLLTLTSGKELKASEYLIAIAERCGARKTDWQVPGLSDPQKFAQLWFSACEQLADPNGGELLSQLDWVAKAKLLIGSAKRHPSLTRIEAQRVDFLYHELTASLAAKLHAKGILPLLIPAGNIRRSLVEAPTETRAKLRSELIAAARQAGRELSVDWFRVALTGGGAAVDLPDPFATNSEQVPRFLAALNEEPWFPL
ncbi:proteasome accessory factor PafA2 family protein [Boudabousia liubingyangii]|nr:proteasome accessory factor PafA2 family protein [Boudabousia liubingyangii]